jgi:hypothetical protein
MNKPGSWTANFNRYPAVLLWASVAYNLVFGIRPTPVSAQINVGRGPFAVRSAWTLQRGYLTSYLHARFFGKVASFSLGQLGLDAVTFWDVQGGLSLNYGIRPHLDLTLSAIAYQDHNQGGRGYNLVDDLFLTLKIGSFGHATGAWRYGLDLGVRFPTASMHNIVFEPYSAGRTSFGATGLVSYAADPLFPENRFSAHFNLGYWNHNDVGEKLSPLPSTIDKIRVRAATQEFIYGVALILPSEKFDFRLEAHGRRFIRQPPVTAYSREAVAYVSPGVSYRPHPWMTLNFSFDVRASRNVDETLYTSSSSPLGVLQITGLPNYPSWRATLGIKMAILPASLRRSGERDILAGKAESRRELFERILREKKKTKDAEIELQTIQDQRRQTERELERLRRILNGEAEPNPTPPNPNQEKPEQEEQKKGDKGGGIK